MTDAEAPPPHKAWLPYLDGWRGISVLAVLFGHFLPIPHINAGRLGVELFFCLSGRLMAGILFVEIFPLRMFILRRITRVWPTLYAFTILVAIAFAAPGPLQVRTIDILGSLTFTANYVGIFVERVPVYDHLWSLAVEEWSYLLLALVALTCRRFAIRPVPILAALAVLCIANGALQTLAGYDYYAVYWRTDVRVASILLPCCIFLLTRGRKVPGWMPIVAGILAVLLSVDRVPDPVKYSLGTGFLSVAIATLEAAPSFVRRMLSFGWLRQIGLWSFSLYLWQQPFAKLEIVSVPVKLAGVVLVALASFYVIENPARRWLNRTIARVRTSMASARGAKSY